MTRAASRHNQGMETSMEKRNADLVIPLYQHLFIYQPTQETASHSEYHAFDAWNEPTAERPSLGSLRYRTGIVTVETLQLSVARTPHYHKARPWIPSTIIHVLATADLGSAVTVVLGVENKKSLSYL